MSETVLEFAPVLTNASEICRCEFQCAIQSLLQMFFIQKMSLDERNPNPSSKIKFELRRWFKHYNQRFCQGFCQGLGYPSTQKGLDANTDTRAAIAYASLLCTEHLSDHRVNQQPGFGKCCKQWAFTELDLFAQSGDAGWAAYSTNR